DPLSLCDEKSSLTNCYLGNETCQNLAFFGKFHFPGNSLTLSFLHRKGSKVQRVKEDQPGQAFDPLSLCPFAMKLLSNFRSL
ncbi:MAG: hypothetical protein ACREEM_42210, partial [Blastocatellia bacterium]